MKQQRKINNLWLHLENTMFPRTKNEQIVEPSPSSDLRLDIPTVYWPPTAPTALSVPCVGAQDESNDLPRLILAAMGWTH